MSDEIPCGPLVHMNSSAKRPYEIACMMLHEIPSRYWPFCEWQPNGIASRLSKRTGMVHLLLKLNGMTGMDKDLIWGAVESQVKDK